MNPTDLIFKLLTHGGAGSVLVALFLLAAAPGWIAWFWERRRSVVREDKLLDLATSQVKASATHEASIEANTEVLKHIDRTIERCTGRGSL